MESQQNKLQKQAMISCPSKTLILGGYAIMNTQCRGISIGLDERFYTYYKSYKNEQNTKKVNIYSPQISSEWKYEVFTNNQFLDFKQVNIEKENQNPFLEACLSVLLKYLNNQEECQIFFDGDLDIYIFFDSGFYSQASQIPSQIKQQNDKFNYFKFYDKNNLAKTGLGSSACVIVSVLSCLLHSQNKYSQENLEILCQMANIQAQKKVGSGFDIKTSIYGSNQYQMFNNAKQLQQELEKPTINLENLINNEKQKSYWGKHEPFVVPEQLKVFMVDLNKGSNTRILAGTIKKFLENAENQQKSQEFFDNTNKYCKLISNNFNDLKNGIDSKNELQQNCCFYRQVLKNIGKTTNVDVEPDQLTILLDEINTKFIDNVYYAICPGAGGYDAFCLLVDKKFDVNQISLFLEKELKGFQDFKFQVREVEISQKGIEIVDISNNNQQQQQNSKNQQLMDEILFVINNLEK